VLCSKCATNLPDGSQFCSKCGQPVPLPATGSAEPPVYATLACSKCGTGLPDGAQFCLRCGEPVSSPAKSSVAADPSPAADVAPSELPRARRKRRIVPWVLLGAFVILIWLASSDNPVAQIVQESVGWKHDQTILDSAFSIGPHTFRYYKFALPAGSLNVAVVGQFGAGNDSHDKGARKEKDLDNNIEVYVLSEAAFTVWQNGYATGSLYDSGRVADGAIHTDLPAGEGIYYLVFSNKFAPKTAKNIHATVLLRYKSWLPEWFRRMNARFWNWLGL
jgi:ribosomal protein L40E